MSEPRPVPTTMTVEHCRSCQAPVVWVRLNTGRMMPVDARPSRGGNVELEERIGQEPLAHVVRPEREVVRFVSHFATCPDRRERRRR